MKATVKNLISFAISNERIWSVLNTTILRATRFADWERQKIIQARENTERSNLISKAIRSTFPDLIVKNGAFQGLRYSAEIPRAGALYSKLLGSYEKEIHPFLMEILKREYTEIINIGCAEGYYAVGMALNMPNARIYAFDISENAQTSCKEMAEINGVSDRITVGRHCDQGVLLSIPIRQRCLLICDCEGCEKSLLSKDVAKHLDSHEILVEIHDFIDPNISNIIRDRFSPTHEIKSISSVDDITKAQSYHFGELEKFDLEERKILLAERRPTIMEWFYMVPKDQN